MALENLSGKTEIFMKEIGKIMRDLEKGSIFQSMVISMREIGNRIKDGDKEQKYIKMVIYIKEIGNVT
jgi:hypothetical protein